MNMEQVVRSVLKDIGASEQLANQAITFATISLADSRKYSRRELSPMEESIMKLYFMSMLYRIATDPDFVARMNEEIRKRTERN